MAESEPFVGEVALFALDFAPRGWLNCDGQLLSIAQNQNLFAILGTTYGGNGVSNFALPNLNGRVAVGQGAGPGLSLYHLGETGGYEDVPLTLQEIPTHHHSTVAAGDATSGSPVDALPAKGTAALHGAAPTVQVNLEATGGGEPHTNMQPSLVLRYCIATAGIYPSRN